MKLIKRLLKISCGLVLLAHLCFAFAALSPLKVEKGQLMDTKGRTVILHGLNEMNKQYPFTPSAIGFDERNIRFIKQHGFNAIRLGIFWSAIEPEEGKYNHQYLNDIKKTILQLNKQGIYTLVDFHQDGYSEKTNGLGAPDWATFKKGNLYLKKIGFPLSSFCNSKKRLSMATCENWDNFWQDMPVEGAGGLQEKYIDMIAHVVRFYKSTPGIFGYDIMNEPFPGTQWTQCRVKGLDFSIGCKSFDSTTLTSFYNKAAQSIHDIDPKKIIFYEPVSLYGIGAPSHIGKIQVPNLGFAYHNYHNPDLSFAFEKAKSQARLNHALPLMGEFGASVANLKQLQTVVELADTFQTSWMEWAYTNNPVFVISHFPGQPSDGRDQGIVFDAQSALDKHNVNFERLSVLSRPYPQAVMGKIIIYNFDASSKTFKLVFRPFKTNAKKAIATKLYLPKLHYPLGFDVEVKGGEAKRVSTNPQRLKIYSHKNATRVEIIITPKKEKQTVRS